MVNIWFTQEESEFLFYSIYNQIIYRIVLIFWIVEAKKFQIFNYKRGSIFSKKCQIRNSFIIPYAGSDTMTLHHPRIILCNNWPFLSVHFTALPFVCVKHICRVSLLSMSSRHLHCAPCLAVEIGLSVALSSWKQEVWVDFEKMSNQEYLTFFHDTYKHERHRYWGYFVILSKHMRLRPCMGWKVYCQ